MTETLRTGVNRPRTEQILPEGKVRVSVLGRNEYTTWLEGLTTQNHLIRIILLKYSFTVFCHVKASSQRHTLGLHTIKRHCEGTAPILPDGTKEHHEKQRDVPHEGYF
jgi:hypothetical protein